MKTKAGIASFDIILIAAVSTFFALILGMVFGDTLHRHIGRMVSGLAGKNYDGYVQTRLTHARTKPRTLKNFDDARTREDQYDRQDEPKQSRKGPNNLKEEL